jgi:hypothetical protein
MRGLITGVLFVGLVIGLIVGIVVLSERVEVVTEPPQVPGATVELIATSPDFKMYKVTAPGAIVPRTVVVGRNHQWGAMY